VIPAAGGRKMNFVHKVFVTSVESWVEIPALRNTSKTLLARGLSDPSIYPNTHYWECAFTAPTHPSRTTPFIDQYNADEIDAELVPQGTLAERMRAAGAGIGAFFTPTSVGTELAEGKEHREINGRLHVLEYPLPADYAFIRAYRADTFGNLQFRLTQRNFNPVMATAATVTIVEIEDKIVPVGDLDPDTIHVPGIYVDRMVLIKEEGN